MVTIAGCWEYVNMRLFGDCTVGRPTYVVHTDTMENKHKTSETPCLEMEVFYFSSTKSESCIGVSAAIKLPHKQAEGTVPFAPLPVT